MLQSDFIVRIAEKSWKDEAYQAAIGVVDDYERDRPDKHWPGKSYNNDKYQDTYKGLLGQIIIREHLKELPPNLYNQISFSPLYTDNLNNLDNWDLKIGSDLIDVKITSPDTRFEIRDKLWVKKREFKGLDWYICVKLWCGERYRYPHDVEYSLCGMATGKEVKNAKTYYGPYAEAYEIDINDLHPIRFKINNKTILLK